jgi:hypothetical protein
VRIDTRIGNQEWTSQRNRKTLDTQHTRQSKHNTENYTFEVNRKWGSSIMKYPDRRGVAKIEKQNKHTFVDLNLVLCCTFSASMLKFQMLLTCMYSLWAWDKITNYSALSSKSSDRKCLVNIRDILRRYF